MNKIRAVTLTICILALVLTACGSLELEGMIPSAGASPTPCVTATPALEGGLAAGEMIAPPASQATPVVGYPESQPTADIAALATREAQEMQQNRPVQLPEGQAAGVPTLPVCPTPTPVK